MNYSSFLQSNPPIEEIMDRFDQDEELHRFEILEAIAGNSLFIKPAIKEWARQSLEKIPFQEIGVSEKPWVSEKPGETTFLWVSEKPGETTFPWEVLVSLAILDPKIIPPHFFDRYEFFMACIRIDAVKTLAYLRHMNLPSYSANVERFRNQPLPITINAWNAIKSN